jgi:hypothetical protein
MSDKNSHPSDQELLLCADGELPRRRVNQIRTHLAACWECRSRMNDFERTISNFVKVHHRSFDTHLPPADGPRTALLRQLKIVARQPSAENSRRFLFMPVARGLAFACGLAFLLALGNWGVHLRTTARDSQKSAAARPLPDRRLTPGATRPVAVSDICSSEHEQVVRPVSDALQQKVFREYGLGGAPVANYEVDYLISPGLGGADDIHNLWPEPRYDTEWNSFVKDQLEDYLHASVCSGNISLAEAQQEVASDWISAYKKYFHTNEPVGTRQAAIRPGAAFI